MCFDSQQNLDRLQKFISTHQEVSILIGLDSQDPHAYILLKLSDTHCNNSYPNLTFSQNLQNYLKVITSSVITLIGAHCNNSYPFLTFSQNLQNYLKVMKSSVITLSGAHCNNSCPCLLKKKIFFGVPHLATFISFFIEYVIASIAYIHPVYGGIRTHDLLDVSLLP